MSLTIRRHKYPLIIFVIAYLLFLTSCSQESITKNTLIPTLAAASPPAAIQTPTSKSALASNAASTVNAISSIDDTQTLQPTPTLSPSLTLPPPPATWTPQQITASTATAIPLPTETIQICNENGSIEFGTYDSQIAGEPMTYRIYLPPCYKQTRVYPTLYIFHGSAQNDSHWDQLGLDEAASELILSGQIPKIIIVMPNGGDISQDSSGGANSFEGVVINELIPLIEENYCVWGDQSARAIGGLSRGGYWALEIAFRNPHLFASVGAHSAALLDEAAGSDLDPAVTGLAANLEKLRIYIDVGKNDYTRAPIQALHESLEDAGKDHQWVLNEGSHQDAYWSAHVRDYLLWYTKDWPDEETIYPDCLLAARDR